MSRASDWSREAFLEDLEAALFERVAPVESSHRQLQEAMAHTLLGTGKRLRPQLVLAAGRLGDPDPDALLLGAAAVEMPHAYSLIHDDLPAMDDDDLRRGRPTCHRVYGEALAILAGDALQALAFETLALALSGSGLEEGRSLELMRRFAETAGPGQLVGGQAADLDPDSGSETLEDLGGVHERKTGALIRFCLELGSSLAGSSPSTRENLADAGRLLGLAFQVVDDLLDATASREELGKTPGKDRDAGKRTYLDFIGEEGCRREAARLLEEALELLPGGESGAELRDLARRLIERSR